MVSSNNQRVIILYPLWIFPVVLSSKNKALRKTYKILKTVSKHIKLGVSENWSKKSHLHEICLKDRVCGVFENLTEDNRVL